LEFHESQPIFPASRPISSSRRHVPEAMEVSRPVGRFHVRRPDVDVPLPSRTSGDRLLVPLFAKLVELLRPSFLGGQCSGSLRVVRRLQFANATFAAPKVLLTLFQLGFLLLLGLDLFEQLVLALLEEGFAFLEGSLRLAERHLLSLELATQSFERSLFLGRHTSVRAGPATRGVDDLFARLQQ